mgnify:CR=1 FL=1|jgi:hypothetical protein|tara:strand:- start:1361 stop:1510 length:150 start_codon:yes stop_codon:yes gene_type:complete
MKKNKTNEILQNHNISSEGFDSGIAPIDNTRVSQPIIPLEISPVTDENN